MSLTLAVAVVSPTSSVTRPGAASAPPPPPLRSGSSGDESEPTAQRSPVTANDSSVTAAAGRPAERRSGVPRT